MKTLVKSLKRFLKLVIFKGIMSEKYNRFKKHLCDAKRAHSCRPPPPPKKKCRVHVINTEPNWWYPVLAHTSCIDLFGWFSTQNPNILGADNVPHTSFHRDNNLHCLGTPLKCSQRYSNGSATAPLRNEIPGLWWWTKKSSAFSKTWFSV